MRAFIENGVVVSISEDEAETGGVPIPDDMPVMPGWTYAAGVFTGPATESPWQARQFTSLAVEAFTVPNQQFPQTTFPAGINVSFEQGGPTRVETTSGWGQVSVGDLVLRSRRDASQATRTALGLTFRDALTVAPDDPRLGLAALRQGRS